MLGFKTELKLNNRERSVLAQHAGVARHAWNQGLRYTRLILDVNAAAKAAGRNDLRIKFPSAIDLHKWLVAEIKPECPWYYESSKSAPQNALRALRLAWDRAFKKISKPPRLKRKKDPRSFTLDGSIRKVGDRKIRVPRIGTLRTYEPLALCDRMKNVTISENCGCWFISYKIEIDPQPTEKTNLAVGVDLGVKHFATLSNRKVFDLPQEIKAIRERIRRIQWLNRNKVVGSKAW